MNAPLTTTIADSGLAMRLRREIAGDVLFDAASRGGQAGSNPGASTSPGSSLNACSKAARRSRGSES